MISWKVLTRLLLLNTMGSEDKKSTTAMALSTLNRPLPMSPYPTMKTRAFFHYPAMGSVLVLGILLSFFMSSCVLFPPSRSYEHDPVNYELSQGLKTDHLQGHTITVQANQAWQPSGVHLTPGSTIKILAMGKWSQAPAFNVWSGPEGLSGTGKEVPWINANALMGKIGAEGKPFEVGPERELRATGEGELHFAINDPFNWVNDNTGSMQVTVYLKEKEDAPATDTVLLRNDGHSDPPDFPLPSPTSASIQGEIGKRTALVIGNAQYEIGSLRNPEHDAQDMAETLKQLGFEVTLLINANQEHMERAISEFGRHLYQGGVGLFYYAGHGVQVDGENYLIPVRAHIDTETDVRYKAVHIGQILGKMGEARNGLNIVILDACRDNPFAKDFRSASRGLAVVSSSAVKGTLIAYATSPGKVASDGDARNGLYTKHLLQNLHTPGLPVEQVFKRVLRGVERETNGRQSPWTSSSFSGDFHFAH
jgi:hypothetical protein